MAKYSILFNNVEFCFPYETSQTTSFSFLFPNVNIEKMTREEVDDFICKLIKSHPYINNAMYIKFSIMEDSGFYHTLTFKNGNHKNQTRDTGFTKLHFEV